MQILTSCERKVRTYIASLVRGSTAQKVINNNQLTLYLVSIKSSLLEYILSVFCAGKILQKVLSTYKFCGK